MDSRIREALEKIEELGTHDTLEGRSLIDGSVIPSQHIVTNFAKIARGALSLLTAEAEPCEDVLPYGPELFPSFTDLLESINNKEPMTEWEKGFKAGVLDASKVSSRREQKARADERRRLVSKLYDLRGEPDKLNAIIMREHAAILQGTEPAKASEEVESLIPQWEDLMVTYNQAVSVPIGEFGDKVDRFRGWKVLRDRLVARLKDGAK